MAMRSNDFIKRQKTGRTEAIGSIDRKRDHTFSIEYIFALFFVLMVGFFGSQKLINTALNPNSSINIHGFSEAICENGFRLPFLKCAKEELAPAVVETKLILASSQESLLQNEKVGLIQGMDQGPNALSLSKQFAYQPSLKSALKKLKWNDGDEQDAARFLSVIKTLNSGRYNESYFVSSAMTGLIDPVMRKYPDIVAASHCLYCGSFFSDVLKPYFAEGTENNKEINQLALGHPRFLQALYQAGNIKLNNLNEIAELQAELLTSGDVDTVRFIGNILLKQSNLALLNQWTSKGMNGGYAISEYSKLLRLPEPLIIGAWQQGVKRGEDNAVLTRYLISTGYRPALRWLIWYHGSNLTYFQTHQHKMEKDRYNDFLVERYLDFPKESQSDLAGFYSKNWKNIVWDARSSNGF